MREYAKVGPQFWNGRTGKALKAKGTEALIVGMYLMTCQHANMLGLYFLNRTYIAVDTGLTLEGATKGLRWACEAGFCHYDEDSEVVWVTEMAFYQVGDQLEPRDNRCKGVQREYDALPENPFLSAFYDRYGKVFHMTNCRFSEAKNTRALQAPLKPLRSQEQEQEQEYEQEQAKAFCTEPQSDSTPAASGLIDLADMAELDEAMAGGTLSAPPAPAPAPGPAEPPVLMMPLVGDAEFGIMQTAIDGWVAAYPGVDVIRQLAAMRQWCIANPRKRKTTRGVLAFCNSWLMKEQDKAGSRLPVIGGKPQKGQQHGNFGKQDYSKGVGPNGEF